MLTSKQIFIKRLLDLIIAVLGLIILGPLILILILIVSVFTGENGMFVQKRVGQYGETFNIFKIKTFYKNNKMSKYARFLRASKLDELPQLWNVVIGDMSVVGPRPDLKGFADELRGDKRVILSLKPGLTGPASLYFHNEEQLLNQVTQKDYYNKKIIWPKKIELNIDYINNYTLANDFKYIFLTILQMLAPNKKISL